MSDDGFSLSPEEINAYEQQQKEQQAFEKKRRLEQQNDPYIENAYDFHKYTADPSLNTQLSEDIKEIDKNWVFGNYNVHDEAFISFGEELISDIDFLLPNFKVNNGKEPKILKAIYRDIFSKITLSRGRKGFAAKLFNTQITAGKSNLTIAKKKKSFFSMKKEDE